MDERGTHALDLRPVRLSPAAEVDHACQTAHTASLEILTRTNKRPSRVGVLFDGTPELGPPHRKTAQSLMESLGLFYDCWGLATQGIFGKPLGNLGKIGTYAK
jgi:hypothetical protein